MVNSYINHTPESYVDMPVNGGVSLSFKDFVT